MVNIWPLFNILIDKYLSINILFKKIIYLKDRMLKTYKNKKRQKLQTQQKQKQQ